MNTFISLFDSLNTLFWLNPWAQSIGIVALFIGGSAFFHREDQKLRRNLTIFTLLMGIQFLMLGLWSAAFAACLGSLRNYISSHTRNIWIMTGFMLALWIVALPNVSELVHLLPILGTSAGTWAMFREQGIRMRLCMLIGSLCWFSHNYMVGSIGGAIIEGVFLIINSRTMLMLIKESRRARQLADTPCTVEP